MKNEASIRVAVLIVKESKILTMRYTYSGVLVHTLPGGNMEFGEELRETAQRELLEELNIDVDVSEEPILTAQVIRNDKTTHHILYKAIIKNGSPKLNPPETSAEEVGWLDLNDLSSTNLYPAIAEGLRSYLDGSLMDINLGLIEQPFY